jgi:hypothetical protein
MGRRCEPRVATSIPVLVRGIDTEGYPFLRTAHTRDVSSSGACLRGLNGIAAPGKRIELEYRAKRAHFRVQWAIPNGPSNAGQTGIRCLDPGKCIWDVPLKEWSQDTFKLFGAKGQEYLAGHALASKHEVRLDSSNSIHSKPEEVPQASASRRHAGGERRIYPRRECRIEAHIKSGGDTHASSVKITDISLGGCYLEMLSPHPIGTSIEIDFPLYESNTHAYATVRSSQSGMGMALQFTEMTPDNFEKLRRFAPPAPGVAEPPFVKSLAPAQVLPHSGNGSANSAAPPVHEMPSPPTGRNGSAALDSTQMPPPSVAEALEAVVRVLFRKELITRAEVSEELARLKSTKR